MGSGNQYATFMVEGILFGIEVERVQEVVRYQDITPIPLAPPALRGLINLRGNIVPALDLRRQLNMNERPTDHYPLNVVVQDEGNTVSLLVDEVGDVMEVAPRTFEAPPVTLRGASRELIRGVYKLKDCLLHILETQKVLRVLDVSAQAETSQGQHVG